MNETCIRQIGCPRAKHCISKALSLSNLETHETVNLRRDISYL